MTRTVHVCLRGLFRIRQMPQLSTFVISHGTEAHVWSRILSEAICRPGLAAQGLTFFAVSMISVPVKQLAPDVERVRRTDSSSQEIWQIYHHRS
jgi:hypothetical protein